MEQDREKVTRGHSLHHCLYNNEERQCVCLNTAMICPYDHWDHRTEQRTLSNQPQGCQQWQQCRQDDISITSTFYHFKLTRNLVSIALQCLAVWCGSPPSLVDSIPCPWHTIWSLRSEACAAAAALHHVTTSFFQVLFEFSPHEFYKVPMGLSASGSQLVTQFFVIYKFLLSLVWIVHFCCFGCFHWSVMLSPQCMLHAVNLYCRIVLFAVATSLFVLCFIYVSTIYIAGQPVCIVFCLLLPVPAVNCRYFYFL